MSELMKNAHSAASSLLQSDEAQLYEELGLRLKAISADESKAGSFEPDVVYDRAQMGLQDDLAKLGRRIFARWNTECYQLICGKDQGDSADRKEILGALGIGDVALASALSALLVSHFAVAPAIAAVIAAIVAKRFFRPAFEEFCTTWSVGLKS